jgi:hypothetical protein
MSLGAFGSLSFELGGDDSPEEKAYNALRSNVGEGGSALSFETVEDSWRWSKSIGLAAIAAFDERALWQFWPETATDRIKNHEEILGLVAAPGDTEEDRRQANSTLWYAKPRVDGPSLRSELTDIDDRLSVLEPTEDSSATTYHGKAFEDYLGDDPFDVVGDFKCTLFPNYSDGFVVHVLFDVPSVSNQEEVIMTRAGERMNTLLPSWVDYRFATSIGFFLDDSPLDLTGMTDP